MFLKASGALLSSVFVNAQFNKCELFKNELVEEREKCGGVLYKVSLAVLLAHLRSNRAMNKNEFDTHGLG